MMQLDTLTLPDDLIWENEFEWNPVEQTVERSVTGALLIQEAAKHKGRSIILNGEQSGWLRREQVLQLQALASTPNKVMPLVLADGRAFSVVFDRQRSPVSAEPLFTEGRPTADALYRIQIQLFVV